MVFIPILILALSATSDSFIIGFNYGIKNTRISNISNAFISLVCFLGTLLSMLLGQTIHLFISEQAASAIGNILLMGFGVYMIFSALFPGRKEGLAEDPLKADKDKNNTIELKESFLIGGLLCINNLGLGIAASIGGMNPLLTSAICAAMSFLFIKAGAFAGSHIHSGKTSKILEIASGFLLLLLGIMELLI